MIQNNSTVSRGSYDDGSMQAYYESTDEIFGAAQNQALLGGKYNIVSGDYSFIIGGFRNSVTGRYGFSLGGQENLIRANHAFAIGGRYARAIHSGAGIISDSENRTHSTSGINTLTLDFPSGVYFANNPSVFGNINFKSRPKVNSSGILLSGEATLTVQDEGSSLGSASKLNFVGAGVSASVAGSIATITVAGAAGGAISFVSVPATPTSDGTQGQMALDQNYSYFCISNNNWRRSAIGSW